MGFKILFLRHGESYSNLPGGDHKWDTALTEKGKSQATEFSKMHQKAAQLDQRLVPQYVFVSSLRRAVETAQLAFPHVIPSLQWKDEAEGVPKKATVIPYFQEGSDWMSDVSSPLQDMQKEFGKGMYFGSSLVTDEHWKTCTLKLDENCFFGSWNIRHRATYTLDWLRNWYNKYHSGEDLTVAVVAHGGILSRLSDCFLGCEGEYMGGKWSHLGCRLFEFKNCQASSAALKLEEIEVPVVDLPGLDGYHERQEFMRTAQNLECELNQFTVMQKQSRINYNSLIVDGEAMKETEARHHVAYEDRRNRASQWTC